MSSIEKAAEKLKQAKRVDKSAMLSAPKIDYPESEVPALGNAKKIDNEINEHKIKQSDDSLEDSSLSIVIAKDNMRDYDKRVLDDEFRLIKRPILQNVFGDINISISHPNLVMVTSSLPGEGKTFTAYNLSLSIAKEMDTTVLLIDSDVVNPSLTKQLGLSQNRGLTDVLLDKEINLSDVIVKTDIPRLRILPAGKPHRNATELLASKQMAAFMKEISARYSDRIVILDTPPLLVTSEANVLADLTGQILVVVEAGKTPQKAIIDAVSMLNSKNKIIGTIINKIIRKVRTDAYGGYYGSYGR